MSHHLHYKTVNLATCSRKARTDLIGKQGLAETADEGVVQGTIEAHPREYGQMAVRLPDGRWAATGPRVRVLTEG